MGRGFQQRAGIDFKETFASVVRYVTIWWPICRVVASGLKKDSADVDTAFFKFLLGKYQNLRLLKLFKRMEGRREFLLKLLEARMD